MYEKCKILRAISSKIFKVGRNVFCYVQWTIEIFAAAMKH